MKPFNVKDAQIGDAIIDKDGDTYKFILHVPEASVAHRVVLLGRSGHVFTITEDGRDFEDTEVNYSFAPVQKHGWVNVYYKPGNPSNVGDLYMTEQAAQDARANTGYSKTVRVEWEE